MPLNIFLRMLNAKGKYEFRIEFVSTDNDKVLMTGKTQANIAEQGTYTDLIFTPPFVEIPKIGKYEFRLWANDQYLGRINFKAILIQKKG